MTGIVNESCCPPAIARRADAMSAPHDPDTNQHIHAVAWRAWVSLRNFGGSSTYFGAGGAPGKQLKLIGAPHRLGARARLQLGQDSGDMMLDGLGAGREPLGDLAVAQPLSQQEEHLELAIGQPAADSRASLGRGHGEDHARHARRAAAGISVAGVAPSRSKMARASRWAASSPSRSASACS